MDRAAAEQPAQAPGGPGCELVAQGLLAEPVAAVTSLAFVVAGAVILLRARGAGRTGPARPEPDADVRRVRTYAVLVAAVGAGSFLQHGPDPAWSDVAHDLPLVATLAFLGADAAADVAGHARRWWWWVVPTGLLLPVIVLAPRAGDVAQVGVAVAAVGLTVLRAVTRPPLRPHVGWAVALLAVGATVGTLSRAGWPLCDPTSLWQGHGVWHVLAATGLAVLAPTVGHAPGRRRSRRR